MSGWRLLADIGGTNARFARSRRSGEIADRHDFRVRDFPGFPEALAAYLERSGGPAGCVSAAISAAGPVADGRVQLTNAPWRFSEAELSAALGDVPAAILNDLEAVARALPFLPPQDASPLGPVPPRPGAARRMLAINVGTGFGAALAVRGAAGWIGVPGEAGHMSLGAQDAAEMALLAPEFAVENVISGPGLLALYDRICARDGLPPAASDAVAVLGRAGDDAPAAEALCRFTVWFARTARNLVLASAAWDGAFLVGGVVAGWREVADPDLFRAAFEAGGPMRPLMSRVPVAVVMRDDVGLLGLSRLEIG